MKTDSDTITAHVHHANNRAMETSAGNDARKSKRRRVHVAIGALCASLLALLLAPASAHACPSRSDPFYIRITAKGDGATQDEGFLAAVDKLAARVRVVADGLRLTPGRRMVVAKTNVASQPLGAGVDRITVEVATWYALDVPQMSMESFLKSCAGPGTENIINEYDMDIFDQ